MFLEDVSSEPMWYVVHTYSGYENKVKASLEKVIENRGMQLSLIHISKAPLVNL